MTVFTFGSINIDHFYRVPHIPAPGETLAAAGFASGLGGKGANQSVAAARAGSVSRHVGMVGRDGGEVLGRLAALGVDVSAVGEADEATGHANVHVDDSGENMIVIYPGANRKQSLTRLKTAISPAQAGDVLLLQNETDQTAEAAAMARAAGLFVIYSAAPFEAGAARAMIGHVDLLVMNEVEAAQLTAALATPLEALDVPHLLITRGARGAMWREQATGAQTEVPAFPVEPVDTTGAGDCFIGTVAAGLDQGLDRAAALRLGTAASALQVTRHGTAEAIPTRDEVEAFLAGQS